jgi:hypothetical protein
MIIKEINLKNADERKSYNEKLHNFEKEFSYPLGQSNFYIKHGEKDYFEFFDQMGETHYFVAEDKGKVVGAGCAILREDEYNKKYWYLCDFKIISEYRGKKILEKMFAKNFLKYVIKSSRFVAVNMGEKNLDENNLIKKIKKIFWFFQIELQWINFHQWKKEDYLKENTNESAIYTNIGKKDIVIDGKSWQLYHGIENVKNNKNNKYDKFKMISINNLSNTDTIMMCCNASEDKYSKTSISGKGVLISRGIKNLKISSLEI